MFDQQRFLFTEQTNSFGQSSIMPYLPLKLNNGHHSTEVMALLDTGASINVLPYKIGLQLGASWEAQTVPIQLSRNLHRSDSKGLVAIAIFLSKFK